jgi:hypothetical protein
MERYRTLSDNIVSKLSFNYRYVIVQTLLRIFKKAAKAPHGIMIYQGNRNFPDFKAGLNCPDPQLERQSITSFGESELDNSSGPVSLKATKSICKSDVQILIEYIGDFSVDGNSVRRRRYRT